MSWNGGSGSGVFFQRIVLLMSLSLILLYIAYELLEAPSKDFLALKIVDFREENNEFSMVLFLSNNSSEKREGHLIFLIGYEGSRVSENATYYCFTNFKTFNFSVVKLNPGEAKKLYAELPPDPEAERIIIVYCYDSNNIVRAEYRSPVLLRRDRTVWVQTWIG